MQESGGMFKLFIKCLCVRSKSMYKHREEKNENDTRTGSADRAARGTRHGARGTSINTLRFFDSSIA